ncbi:endo-1,4-beta-xylanase [Cellulomonas algicola]|uniref:endo-1,4-beta-xylanase n=1 Tax=Cellulomonas algicola TaxID=2071633 RepID=UPI001C3FC49F|nr:endo-1,4-beta-xylanase [Cellulomonas algicola]
MRQPRGFETIGIGIVAVGVIAAPIVGILPTATTAAAASPTVVSSTTFEDGTTGIWQQSGNPTVSVVDVDGGKVLQVANRAADYEGVQTAPGALADLVPGTEYTISMRARLADGTTGGPAGVRFVMKPAYTWIGSTTMTADAWTTVAGTYTVPATGTAPSDLQLYLGTGDLTGAYTYLVDDLVITGPAAAGGPSVVLTSTFESAGHGWTARGSGSTTVATTTTQAHGGTSSLLVTGRTAGWNGAQHDVSSLLTTGTYDVEAWVRLADGEAGPAQLNLGMQTPGAANEYPWVGGRVAVTAGEWTKLSGTYTVDPATPPTNLYVESDSATASFLVDDVVITGQASTGPGEVPDVPPGGALNPTTTPVATAAAGSAPGVKRAALTFDDGPNGAATTELLDFLAAKDVPATFCVIGQNVTTGDGASVLRRIVSDGHTLCNHSTDYSAMDGLTQAQAAQKMAQNLTTIRTALGDANAQVPFFRAPNGAWGQTPAAAVSLGMQPLAVTNLINDWDATVQSDVEALKANLRAAMKDGEIVLVHDGGGNRANSVAALKAVVQERLDAGWEFTLPSVTLAPSQPVGSTVIDADFEDGMDGWFVRETGSGTPTATVTTTAAHGGAQAALVANRSSQGHGLAFDVDGVLVPGTLYELSAWVRFAAGQPADDVWLTVRHDDGGTQKFTTLAQVSGQSNSQWVELTASIRLPEGSDLLYLETDYNNGNTSDFLVDDIVVTVASPLSIEEGLTPIKDTLDFPFGAAIQARDTVDPYGRLLTKHFDQITPENFMKPEAWYDANDPTHTFVTTNSEADALMTYAAEHDLKVYGHVLVWHSQTPDWFFQDGSGRWLTDSPADQAVLKARLRTHIDNVAQYLSDKYGKFGSATNPLYAFDVVNEVVSDGSGTPGGMRTGRWFQVLGEEFVDLSFEYANDAFNGTYAAPGQSHPVTLFINDYNTEQAGKQQRYHDLIARMIDRGVEFDGIGHQFHVSLATPVSTLAGALDRMADLGKVQAITEFDVTTGTPVTEAKLVDQGYYYQDAFDAFRAFHAETDQVFSATVWGLVDGRSWRNDSGAPLVFDDQVKAKPAYHGIVDASTLPAPMRAANVFQGTVPLDDDATSAPDWDRLPLLPMDESAAFQLRWEADHLTAFVVVPDATPAASDGLTFSLDGETYAFGRDGAGDVDGVATELGDGWAAVVHLPLDAAAVGDQLAFDVTATDGSTTVGWNKLGATGTLTLVEPLSYLEVAPASSAPTVDGEEDAVWADAASVSTTKVVGAGSDAAGAVADVRTLWKDDTLYVLATVTDAVVNTAGSDPWTQDSVEIFVDPGNAKNGSYRYDDTQLRISADNVVSVGTGDEAYQKANLTSATRRTASGYVVEAAIGLHDQGGAGTFHGLDFQVNDATADGARTSIHTWAEPTGTGYQTTERWGVGRLVEAAGEEPEPSAPTVVLGAGKVARGGTVPVALSGFTPGTVVDVVLGAESLVGQVQGGARLMAARAVGSTGPLGLVVGSFTVDASGGASGSVRIPATTAVGRYGIAAAVDDQVLAATVVDVVAAAPGGGASGGTGGSGGGSLATTGAQVAGLVLLALALLGAGTAMVRSRRRGTHVA